MKRLHKENEKGCGKAKKARAAAGYRMKKGCCGLLAAAAALGLCACGETSPEPLVVAAPSGYGSKCKAGISDAVSRLGLELDVEVIEVPVQTTTSGEEESDLLDQLRTELMAGEGPDLLLLDSRQELFQDVLKTARGGAFYDLAPLLDDAIAEVDCLQPVMDAGVIDGKRYLVPLGFDIWGVSARGDWLDGWRPDAAQPTDFVLQLREHAGRDLTLWEECLTNSCTQPLLDSAAATMQLSPQLADIALYCRDNEKLPRMMPRQDEFWENTLAQTMLMSYIPPTKEMDLRFLPVPNGEDGFTAEVSLLAAVRANSPHAEQAAAIIGQLLQPARASANSQFVDAVFHYTMLPVGREARELYCKTDGSGNARPEDVYSEIMEITSRVNAARIRNKTDWNATNVFIASVCGGRSPEEAFEYVQKKYRFYFEE